MVNVKNKDPVVSGATQMHLIECQFSSFLGGRGLVGKDEMVL